MPPRPIAASAASAQSSGVRDRRAPALSTLHTLAYGSPYGSVWSLPQRSVEMKVELAIAGWICVFLAAGHTMIGVRWVLPAITQEQMPATPFGPRSFTVGMIRITWFVVTVFALGMAG